MDLWHLKPGERYFRHDRDSWPFLPGQSFEIFNECLEDQLAREALAASPLNYDHDDKENNTNHVDTEPVHNLFDNISVMPASQYRLSSEDVQVSQQHALVEQALYEMPPTQSYGLGGTDGVGEEHTTAVLDCRNLLASGSTLPPTKAQEEAQVESQDSVIGRISPITTQDLDSVLGSCSDLD
jgi:hypothetical protein